MTIVVLLLFGLIFGIISYAYMMSFRQSMTQAAAEGARAGAVSAPVSSGGDPLAAAQNALNDALASFNQSCGGALSCSISIDPCAGNSANDCVTVDISYDYDANPLLPNFPGLGLVLPDALEARSVAEIN